MPYLSALKRHLTRTTLGLALIPALAVCTADNGITSSDDAEAALRRNGNVATVSISPGNATASVGLTMQFTATAKDPSGNTLNNQSVTWSTSDPGIVTISTSGLATAVSVGSATIMATIKGRNASATATVTAAPLPAPTAVNNLSVTATTTNSATLSFTEVTDGSGQAADYEVRYALSPITWSAATRVASGSCAAPLAGTTIGATMTCTVLGLSSNAAYNFQVVAFRGTLSNPVNGALSNVAAASTQAEASPPPPPPTPVVTSVAVSPSSASLTVGGTQPYTATARDQSGNVMTGLPVSWSSSNAAVASVTSQGVGTAVSAGSAQIIATVSGILGSSTVTVTAAAPPPPPPPPPAPSPVVTTVSVTPSSASIQTGATQALTATVKDQNGAAMTGQTVTWSSSNSAIASVNSSGVVSGVAAGSATITATSSSKTGTSTITVTAPAPPPPPPPPPPSPVVTTVSVSPTSASIAVAGTQTLTATVKDQNGATMTGQTVTWSSSNSAAATVSAGGVVTGVAAGSATITATSSGKTGTATITVTAPTPVVTTVTVAPSTATILVGATTTLVATVKDQNGATMTGQTVTWSSNNTARATVNSSGVVTGVSAGAVTITATSSGKSGTAAVTVNAPAPPTPVPTTVTVSPSTATIVSGSTTTLSATVKDQNGATMTGQTITWTTSNAIAATVNGSGVVTGVAAGTATITATSSGKTGTASVTVTAAPPPPPPPPPGSGTLLFSENFENASLSSRGWYDNTSPALSTTEHLAGSVSSLQFHWTAGATTPVSGGSLRHKFTAGNSFYLSYNVKYSANYVGSGQAYHPHEFHALSNLDDDWTGPSDTYMTLYIEQNYQNGGRPKLAMQDNKSINTSMGSLPRSLIGLTENRSVSGCNGVAEANVQTECFTFSSSSGWYNLKGLMGPVTFNNTPGSAGYKNSWNYVEAYFQMNSIVNGVSQADGVMQYWFNGQLIIDRHDIVFRTAARANLMFDKFVIAPYIGDGSPVDQYMWIDNLRVATARIP